MNKSIKEELYALIIQIICVPVLGAATFEIFKAFAIDDISETVTNVPLALLVYIILFFINIAIIFFIVFYLKKKFTIDIKYYLVTGFVSLMAITWYKVYYLALQDMACLDGNTEIGCTNIILKNHNINTILTLALIYYLIFTVVLLMFKKSAKHTK